MDIFAKTVAFDLDGTILEYDESMANSNRFGPPVPGMPSEIRKLWKDGWRIIIWTCRARSQELVDHLNHHRIPFHEINTNVHGPFDSPKIHADVYVDDKAISFDGDSTNLARRIKAHKSWWKK